jgi:hypothetical protein
VPPAQVAHDVSIHAATAQRRREGHELAAMEGHGQPVLLENKW